MTSAAQLASNRLNAQKSTGPRTEAGKARSSLNAVRHGILSQLPVGLQTGPFLEKAEHLEAFAKDLLAELDPRSVLERTEALNIVALLVRRRRLVEFEALALAHSTRTNTLPPEAPGMPQRILERDLALAGANALNLDLFGVLPRYEGHLNRQLDGSLARYDRLQAARRAKEGAIVGEIVDPHASDGWSQHGAA